MDREPRQPDPPGEANKTLAYVLLFVAESLSFNLKTFRRARGPRADAPLVRGAAVIGFPFVVPGLGYTDPGVIAGTWLFHVGMVLVMGLSYAAVNRKTGPIHSRYVGQSFPEVLGFPASLSKLIFEPAMWFFIGIGCHELGQKGLGNFYMLGSFCLLPEWLIILQRDATLSTDAVDARIEAEERAAHVRNKLGG